MKAYIFPGQGAQYTGMGKNLYEKYPFVKELFKQADRILKFDLTQIMFEGSSEDLRQTKVTQPAIFLHSVALAKVLGDDFQPDMVAGHSLGEFSALVANGTLAFEDGLKLVAQRAFAMQKACEMVDSTMAAVIALEDSVVEKICEQIKDDVVVAANYNCLGQIVISGSKTAIEKVSPLLKEAGAKRVLPLSVGGAFHSPLMEPARLELAEAIKATKFQQGMCPIYQNVTAQPVSSIDIIRENLEAQLTSPVRWTQTIQNMVAAGTTQFVEVGPGTVLQGLVKKIAPNAEAVSLDGTL
ncbi:MAG: ACP S-malonyltransferase [Bacteroidales bacterium]|nr:ACP S-malonyltransferase [Bacteroidales bacterium]